jgi:hypothetical protein
MSAYNKAHSAFIYAKHLQNHISPQVFTWFSYGQYWNLKNHFLYY